MEYEKLPPGRLLLPLLGPVTFRESLAGLALDVSAGDPKNETQGLKRNSRPQDLA